MPRSKNVTMAGQEYTVAQLPMRANKEWRDRLTDPVNRIIALMKNYKDIEIGSVADVAGLLALANDVLLGSMDLLLDSLFAYAPELSSDRERIEAETYDDEAIAALGVVIGLAYPLDRLLTVWIGQAATQTLPNSPLVNGVSGAKKMPVVHRKNT